MVKETPKKKKKKGTTYCGLDAHRTLKGFHEVALNS